MRISARESEGPFRGVEQVNRRDVTVNRRRSRLLWGLRDDIGGGAEVPLVV